MKCFASALAVVHVILAVDVDDSNLLQTKAQPVDESNLLRSTSKSTAESMAAGQARVPSTVDKHAYKDGGWGFSAKAGKKKKSLAAKSVPNAEYDFVLAGAGTGGLGYAGRVAATGKKVLVLEAGRFIHPYLKLGTFTIDGVSHKRMLPINWPAFADAWLSGYAGWGVDGEDGSVQAANGFFNPYGWVPKMEVVAILRALLAKLQGTSEPMPLESLEDVTLMLQNSDKSVNSTFVGNPIALLDDIHSDLRLSQFIGGYGSSEDVFYFDGYYTNGPDSKLQNYPRGKTVGGSSVNNAQIHYGVTKQFMNKMASLLKDKAWTSKAARRIVRGSNTITCDPACLGTNSTRKEKCRGPVFGMCMQHWPTLQTQGLNDYNQFYEDYMATTGKSDKSIYMSDWDHERRLRSKITTRSENPFSGTRSSSADAIANVLGLGIGVCFFPHPTNKIILSEQVLPDEYNCNHPETRQTAGLQVRTGTLVTGLTFDEVEGLPRATGVEWVYEGEQERPDQNRYYNNVARACKASKNLYGVGKDNTSDCMNRGYQFENNVDASTGEALSEAQWKVVKARASTADGVIRSIGTKNLEDGQYAPYQVNVPQDAAELPPLRNVQTARAKVEVALGMGAPGTTATLMRSGISRPDEARRLMTTLRADLPVGKMSNNYEFLFQPLVKNLTSPHVANFWADAAAQSSTDSQDSFDRSYLKRSQIDHSSGFFDLREYGFVIRVHPRKCSNGRYELNHHHYRTSFSSLSSTIYTTRATESTSLLVNGETGGLIAAPGFMPELSGESNDDSRQNTAFMKLRNAHPLGKIGWMNFNALNEERCQCYFEAVDSFMKQLDENFPDVGFESLAYTKRRRSINDFLTGWDAAGTGSAVFTQAAADQYFDDVNNPIVAGYRGPKGKTDPVEFCAQSQLINGGHHIQGGAIMGRPEDDTAVTDSKGKVYNVHNLRVVDISALPLSPDGNPWVSVFQLGNLMALFAAQEHGLDTRAVAANADPTQAPHPYAGYSGR